MNALDILTSDHREVEAMIAVLEEADGGTAEDHVTKRRLKPFE